jgi:hypothetical protein
MIAEKEFSYLRGVRDGVIIGITIVIIYLIAKQ